MEKETQTTAKPSQHMEPKMVPSSSEKKDHAYRDRAAKRRTLHGGFGVGPGQKKSADDDSSTAVSDTPEEAAAEALNISFGVGSYARRTLEKMGWKEGEALGSSMKGLTEPLQLETKEVRVWDGIRIETGSMPDLNQTVSALYRSRSLQASHGLSCWHSLKL